MEEETGPGEGLMRQLDGYCERVDFTYWSEPVNAVTNAAFLIAAIWMWRRIALHGAGEATGVARALCVILGAIGVGSYLFHTHATVWSVIADVAAIAVYIVVYCYAANRHFWGLPVWVSMIGAAAFIPYAAVVGGAFGQLPFFEISAAYWPVPLLILIYAGALWTRRPETARGLLLGVGILVASLTFRSVDELVCEAVPLGTHFVWHILNAIMLGWMIEVLRRDGGRPLPQQAQAG
ncbi:MAG: ceramidase domain-containing protein [Pseudomonadota bacterium]